MNNFKHEIRLFIFHVLVLARRARLTWKSCPDYDHRWLSLSLTDNTDKIVEKLHISPTSLHNTANRVGHHLTTANKPVELLHVRVRISMRPAKLFPYLINRSFFLLTCCLYLETQSYVPHVTYSLMSPAVTTTQTARKSVDSRTLGNGTANYSSA